MPRSTLVRTSTVGYALLFAFSLSLAWWQGRLEEMFVPPGWASTLGHVVFGIVLAGGVLAFGECARRVFVWARRLDDEFRRLLPPLSFKGVLILAAGSGIAEETFFRGILQPAFGLYLASLLFGLLHYPMNSRMLPWTGIALGMGFVFGVVYSTTDSVLTVALAHALINFIELLRMGKGAAAVDDSEKVSAFNLL